MRKPFLLIVIFLTAIAITAFPQERMQGQSGQNFDMSNFNGIVTGKVIDSLDKTGVEFANIAIYRMRDSSLVTGTLTDASGSFIVEKLMPGRYYMDVKYIGYQTRRVDGIAVSPRAPKVDIGSISILAAAENIDAVVVTGEKKMLLHNLDKKVFNVEKDIAVEGGTAVDVLQNIPSVEVDTDGNVSLRGSSNVNILIDGRPSMLNSMEELPAQMIDRIEVITNPSAKYDPDGVTGIINIVLKKRKEPGYNGMVSLNAGTGNKYNTSVNMNWRQDKVNVFANYNFRHGQMDRYSLSERITSMDQIDSSFLNQNSTGQYNMLFHNIRGGLDYFIDSKTTLSFTGNLNLRSFDMDNDMFSKSYTNFNSNTLENTRKNTNSNDGLGHEYSLNFKRTYDAPGKEWTADIFFSRNKYDNLSNINQQETLNSLQQTDILERATTDGWMNSFTAQTDYVTPFGNGGRVETGLKAQVRRTDADYIYNVFTTNWEVDSTRSNHFVYSEEIYSAYGIYSNTFANGKFSYQLGLRVEDQHSKSDQQTTNQVADTNRLNLFPTAHIRWEPNSINSLQLSYSRRVNRPNAFLLNPFLNTSDKFNWTQGNPYLEPEFTSSIDLSHNLNFPKTKITTSVYYRDTRNGFSRRMEVVDTVTTQPVQPTLSKFINLSHYENLGAEAVITQNITKWWRINASYSYYYSKLFGNVVSGANEGSSWNVKFASFFNLGKNIDLQLTGNYRAPSVTVGGSGRGFYMIGGAQGETKEMYWLDLGARISLFNRKGTITLRVSDIFNTQKMKYSSWDNNFFSYNENWRDSRVVFIGFSYRINNYKMRQDRISDTDDSMDMME